MNLLLITKKKLVKLLNDNYEQGFNTAMNKVNSNLNQPNKFCNTGCRTAKCVKASK